MMKTPTKVEELWAEEDVAFKELVSAVKALEPMMEKLEQVQTGLRLSGVVTLRTLHPGLQRALLGQWQIWRQYPQLLGERECPRSNPEEDKRADALTRAESLCGMWKLQQENLSARPNSDTERRIEELKKPLRVALEHCDALGVSRPADAPAGL
jgi:hypothetical protein